MNVVAVGPRGCGRTATKRAARSRPEIIRNILFGTFRRLLDNSAIMLCESAELENYRVTEQPLLMA